MTSKRNQLCETCQRLTGANFVRVGKWRGEHCFIPAERTNGEGQAPIGTSANRTLPMKDVLRNFRERTEDVGEEQALLHHSWAALEKLARTADCHLCSLIHKTVLEECRLDRKDDPSPNAATLIAFTLQYDSSIEQHYSLAKLNVFIEDAGHPGSQSGMTYCSSLKIVRSDTISHLGETNSSRPLSQSREDALDEISGLALDDDHSEYLRSGLVSRLEHWIHECEHGDHPSCKALWRPTTAPTRLLRIDRETYKPVVRLIETAALTDVESPSYATLSHCWGTSMPLRLLNDNYTDWLQGVDSDTLPRTFHEAVLITAALGIPYLWIDALCIVQDSEQDWLTEAPSMCNVYAGSSVTIAATAATDCHGGLFVPDLQRIGCEITLNSEDFFEGTFVIKEDAPYWRCIQHAPLNERGWVFQERLLSRRVIHFTSGEVWWTCSDYAGKEFSIEPITDDAGRNARDSVLSIRSLGDLIKLYTAKTLTYPADRLVAFAGIAEARYRQRGLRPSDYAAGLSGNRILSDVLWSRVGEFCIPDQSFESPAPTWSWTSHTDEIAWPFDELRAFGEYSFNDQIEIRSIDVQLRGANVFGAIDWATIRFTGLILEVMGVGPRFLELRDHEGVSQVLPLNPQGMPLHPFRQTRYSMRDVHGLSGDWRPTHAVPLAFQPYKGHETWGVFGLLLISRVRDRRGTFRRIDMWMTLHEKDQLPSWWMKGSRLEEEDYLRNYNGGRYDIDII